MLRKTAYPLCLYLLGPFTLEINFKIPFRNKNFEFFFKSKHFHKTYLRGSVS